MVERLGCGIPHHVQMFFSHVKDHLQRQGRTLCTLEDVDSVYKQRMLSTRGHAELSTFEERLRQMLSPEGYLFALDLLTEAAVVKTLTPSALAWYQHDHGFTGREAQRESREVLDILVHDGYLRQTTNGYVFISHLLRDWWYGRFSFGFIPAEQRASSS